MDGPRKPRNVRPAPVPRLHVRHERRYWKIFQNWLGDAVRSASTRQRRALVVCILVVGLGLISLNTPNATGTHNTAHLATAVIAIWVGVFGLCLWIGTGARG